jgi:DNA modification methylase/superfamily II DNA or RNA helicase
MITYADFLATKRPAVASAGLTVMDADINPILFPFQRDLVRWAVRKGRAAIFADTGLGKTFMQVEWARLTGVRVLIVAPLSVARQTVREAAKLGVEVVYVRDGIGMEGFTRRPIYITNYEMLGHSTPSDFGAIVLDESSILKAMDGKTRQRLTEFAADIPYRLCCTATPAPNDITEIANHAEFLGLMSRAEMMSAFFVHVTDAQAAWQWRLKGHAEQPFYRWLASWGMSVRKPSDLGYDDEGYDLPPLNIEPRWVEADYRPDGKLFHMGLHGVTDRAAVRKATLTRRVESAAALVNERGGQWLLWCGLNEEADALARLIPGSVNVQGSDSAEAKAEALEAFQSGETCVLITKAKIAGFGMNFQNAHQMAFVGLSDSWEAYYQCIRRCWRFGQTEPVNAYIVLSDAEEDIYQNVMRKEEEANLMRQRLIEHSAEYERAELGDMGDGNYIYEMDDREGDLWRLMLGDSCERLAEVATDSVDLSVFSPPFLSLYTYSPTERDVGNSRTPDEFYRHFGVIIDELMRVTKPGRNCCVHVSQVSTTLATDGVIGLRDFRGGVISQFVQQGWTYYGEVCIDKDPQAQAIRTHSKGLLFVQLHKDSVASRPALADYILVFQKPGENAAPVVPDLANDEWIEWARPIWYGIRESDTLNVAEGREDEDEKHIAPLQLGTIERCIRLWSNKGETVLSPFAGIGSEGYVAVKNGRRFVGIELKRSYFDAASKNMARAEESVTRRLL